MLRRHLADIDGGIRAALLRRTATSKRICHTFDFCVVTVSYSQEFPRVLNTGVGQEASPAKRKRSARDS
jgi:hypothetical protein